jgi:hypothetical protein
MGGLSSRCLDCWNFKSRQVSDNTILLNVNNQGPGDPSFDDSSNPTPLLTDLNFAIVDDNESDSPSGSPGENAAIEKLLSN